MNETSPPITYLEIKLHICFFGVGCPFNAGLHTEFNYVKYYFNQQNCVKNGGLFAHNKRISKLVSY